MRPLHVHGRALPMPAVCIPLVARQADALRAEAAAAGARGPDLLEWRVDFFDGIGRTAEVVALAAELRRLSGRLPLLFTRRSVREGGQPIPLDEAQVLALVHAVAAAGAADLVDIEMASDPVHIAAARDACRAQGLGLVLSFHDFDRTPPAAELLERFRLAHRLGADLAKVAVMPRRKRDVLALLEATLQASEELPIAVAGMSMGALGAVSRLAGGEFGSALTFAVGQAASAPGQMPVDGLRAALAVLRRGSAG
ncbi:MAG TPA: type I 3-dehydroquinate dehydratase [Ramlibacter sp.]|jgi:3-dehydroquinate dehydratase-1|uniref:type I 3-dehydroquinate dehydratase n=1 Tax=Ramlibacter sp. TaxID=1917967 RepID=UPI002D2D2112|nr:type I 3-dehydroquinate dehydratase [Ramlibacter sp.]HZY17507.1 type I 3-dehydroquinate dehydratase [Ramlibacter sp.]